jgi:hypothetical protein
VRTLLTTDEVKGLTVQGASFIAISLTANGVKSQRNNSEQNSKVTGLKQGNKKYAGKFLERKDILTV